MSAPSQLSALRWLEALLGEELKGAIGPSPPKEIDRGLTWPFTRLEDGTFLHDRTEKDVYRILIDSYRLRMEEHCLHGGKPVEGSIYAGVPSGLPGFRHYLGLAATRDGLLPSWWTPEKQRKCEAFGLSGSEWQDLRLAVEESALMWHYGDSRYPSQLRMLAEIVYGREVGGVSSLIRMRELAVMEARSRAEEASS